MGIAAHIVTAITAVITAVVPASCSKITGKAHGSAATGPQAMAAAAVAAENSDSKTRDLGELSLTNHYELEVIVAHGKTCLIVPNLLDRRNLQLTMSLQTKNDHGKVEDLSVTQITGSTGKPIEVALGDMDLTLTPIVQE